ncbi:MAG: CPBP family intramembrane metalloprotease [Lachnospiraceae bacterium]|nr:CPBP family intramembrane metalloprotease [Lachnospiraceae bacterium]
MSIILLLILITYQTVASVMDMRDIKKRKGIDITEKMRIDFYKETIIWGWFPVGIIFLFMVFTSMSIQDIGFRKIVLSDFMWLNIAVFIIVGIMIISLAYQVIMYFSNEKFRKETAIEIENKKNSGNHYDEVVFNLILPRTLKEKMYFFFVSFTAGVCEEIHLRGCLMFLLSDIFQDLHIVVIGVIASLLFGVFHCYQGMSGVIKTSIGGMLFVAIYFVTDSLVPGIVLHFLFDFSSAFLVREERKV